MGLWCLLWLVFGDEYMAGIFEELGAFFVYVFDALRLLGADIIERAKIDIPNC